MVRLWLCLFGLSLLALSCSRPDDDQCRGAILDLEFDGSDTASNPLVAFLANPGFEVITDSSALLRYEKPGRLSFILQRSSSDPKKRRFEYRALEGVIRSANFQWDLLALVDHDKADSNVQYWLKGFDLERKKVGHLDFASYSQDEVIHGRIDCDTTLHLILPSRNEHRVFRIDETGANVLLRTTKIVE